MPCPGGELHGAVSGGNEGDAGDADHDEHRDGGVRLTGQGGGEHRGRVYERDADHSGYAGLWVAGAVDAADDRSKPECCEQRAVGRRCAVQGTAATSDAITAPKLAALAMKQHPMPTALTRLAATIGPRAQSTFTECC